jgi:leucyl-tRNA synthetase
MARLKSEPIAYAAIEKKWQERWSGEGIFKAPRLPRPGKKFYCLDMFPYPSADGLHVGHPEGYTATDVLCRMKRMQDFDVLHPMGWDAFGLPAENFALKTGRHPRQVTEGNISNFKRQIQSLGFSYDWDREVDTTDPAYYKWTQWIFLKLFEKGLAYEATAPINWCPSCKTGLANEEVFGGSCERCTTPVEQKKLRQWVLKITAYADRLENDLDELDWPASTLAMQRHWIGRSEGAEVVFKTESGEDLRVFTTRPDTLYGATYMVVAPEHPSLESLTTPAQKMEVAAYVAKARAKSEFERTDLQKEKTGVFTGSYAINPVNAKRIPIWAADYVLSGYGTGAIMAVPAHDERDFEFAKRFNLPIVIVVRPDGKEAAPGQAFAEDGIVVNSPSIDGLKTAEAKTKIIEQLAAKGLGKKAVQYKLRDWLFSRQRYWGEPIPIVHCKTCGVVPVPEKELPVLLPNVDNYKPTGTGESPLAAIDSWVETKCPKCAGPGRRETNTMPQWAGSCWYYLRYVDPRNDKALCAPELSEAWLPVDCYVGGSEHAVLHLLYARFWHKVLYDLGLVKTKEPFKKLRHQGMILSFSHRDSNGVYHSYDEIRYDEKGSPVLTESGETLSAQVEKMSKSKKNVVNPDAILAEQGADAFRLYEMFMGPFEQAKPWDMRSIEGVGRFLRKVATLVFDHPGAADGTGLSALRHRTIKKVTEDIEDFGFNTAISALMIYANSIQDQASPARVDLEMLLVLLHPLAPHLTEELWENMGHKDCLARYSWPSYDPNQLREETAEYAVQVNGRLRDRLVVASGTPAEAVLSEALSREKIRDAIGSAAILKKICVPGRLVNFVVKNVEPS